MPPMSVLLVVFLCSQYESHDWVKPGISLRFCTTIMHALQSPRSDPYGWHTPKPECVSGRELAERVVDNALGWAPEGMTVDEWDLLDEFVAKDCRFAKDPVDGHTLTKHVPADESTWSPRRKYLVEHVCPVLWATVDAVPRESTASPSSTTKGVSVGRAESASFWLSADCHQVQSSHPEVCKGLQDDALSLGDFELDVEVQPLPCPWPSNIPRARPRFLATVTPRFVGRPAKAFLEHIGFTESQTALLPEHVFQQPVRRVVAVYMPSGNDQNIEMDTDMHRITVCFETS